jgi:hypothetical protein
MGNNQNKKINIYIQTLKPFYYSGETVTGGVNVQCLEEY